jgi:hypothetical protein
MEDIEFVKGVLETQKCHLAKPESRNPACFRMTKRLSPQGSAQLFRQTDQERFLDFVDLFIGEGVGGRLVNKAVGERLFPSGHLLAGIHVKKLDAAD